MAKTSRHRRITNQKVGNLVGREISQDALPFDEDTPGPLAIACHPAAQVCLSQAQKASVSAQPPGQKTILVVEDEPDVRRLVAEILYDHGYRILEAANGVEALGVWRLHRNQIDLLFTDISLPGGLNGLRLADMLRESTPTLKVIFTSGYGDELMDEARVAAGMVYLPKPCDIDAMARAIRTCFAQH